MKTLNLINPAKSDIPFTSFVFPDGQPHVKLDIAGMVSLDRKAPSRILTRISNPADLMLVLFLKNTLDTLEFEHVELHITYLMAARMDRVMLDGEPFSLKVVATIINQARFKKVLVFDPHSDVTTALIDRAYAVSNHAFVKDVFRDYFSRYTQTAFSLVSPDAGALKKIYKLAAFLGTECVVECTKHRDLKTGALTQFNTSAENLTGQTCFIIDDICDGGGTFIGTAEMLKKKGADKIVLVVSHGIFSKGIQLNAVDEVYTTNSFRDIENVKCFAVEPYL